MGLYCSLDNPRIYNFKTCLFSFGLSPVAHYLFRWTKLYPASRVLDVGCGTGRHARLFPVVYCGVDRDVRYVRHAHAHSPGCFAVMDAVSLAVADSTFDFVYCAGLCHHLPDDRVLAVAREMRRVLQPGGYAVIIDGVLPRAPNLPGYLMFKLDRGEHARKLAALEALLARENYKLIDPHIPRSYPYCRAAFAHHKPH